MRILIGLAVVMLWVPCGVAQNASCGRQSCVGEDFWVTFLCNDDDPANALLSVIATGSQQARHRGPSNMVPQHPRPERIA
ncbi:MAG: hypothetical protein IJL38_07530 [Bacteroidales bacterium]|nr:hypothetical protein [Bacteroidales bacterium]